MSVAGDAWEFATARLQMRAMTNDDATLYCDMFSDERTMRFIAPALSPQRALRSFRKYMNSERSARGRVFIAIIEQASARPVGICTIQQLDERRRRVEAGIMLKRRAQARGYAREGLVAVVTRAFDILPIDTVWVQFAANHAVVERLVVSVGFTRCGTAAAGTLPVEYTTWTAARAAWAARWQSAAERPLEIN